MNQIFEVAIPTVLRSYTGNAATVSVAVASPTPRLGDVLAGLEHAFPGIRFRMVDEAGRMRPHIQIFVNNAIQRDPVALLPRGARIMVVGALSGG